MPEGAKVVDVTGLSLYFGSRGGYTFANLDQAETDPDLRWVVVRDNHLKGPWIYCRQLKGLVDGLKPVAEFPANPKPGQSRVYVFEKPLNLAGKTPVEPRG